jgi:hypothetical protein
VSRIIEVAGKVDAYERALEKHKLEHLEHVQQVQARFGAAGQRKLGLQAWPLRPLFIDQTVLGQICAQMQAMLERFRGLLQSELANHDGIEGLGLDRRILESLGLERALGDPELLSLYRPDGFFHGDRYIISEFNVGSGLMATLAYTEVLEDLLCQSPIYRSLGWSAPSRPFRSYLRHLRGRFPSESEVTLALLLPMEEKELIYDWELDLFSRLWKDSEFRVLFVDESELYRDSRGTLRDIHKHQPVHGVVLVSTGENYLEDPEKLASIASRLHWEGASDVLFHPLACLAFGKGCQPRMHLDSLPPLGSPAVSAELAATHWPDSERADEYRLEKQRWVIKRAWSRKNTFVGCNCHGRLWNQAVAQALDGGLAIIQEYHPLPTLDLPFLIDGAIEKVPIRFELSPFVIGGTYAGALVRYAPSAEGVILSPSPPDLGITIVC